MSIPHAVYLQNRLSYYPDSMIINSWRNKGFLMEVFVITYHIGISSLVEDGIRSKPSIAIERLKLSNHLDWSIDYTSKQTKELIAVHQFSLSRWIITHGFLIGLELSKSRYADFQRKCCDCEQPSFDKIISHIHKDLTRPGGTGLSSMDDPLADQQISSLRNGFSSKSRNSSQMFLNAVAY